jgi:hypothetical protein
MGIIEDPKYFKLNVDLEGMVAIATEGLLWEFKDVFTWNYEEFKRIPPHIAKHKIELNTTIPPFTLSTLPHESKLCGGC